MTTGPSLTALFWTMVAAYAAASAGSLARAPRVSRGLTAIGTLVGSVAALALAVLVILGAGPLTIDAPGVLAAAGGVVVHLDRLGAFFLAVIGGVALPVGLYGWDYAAAYDGRYSLRWMALNMGVFLLSMSLVVCAGNAITFVLAWELMATSSFFLVTTEHERRATVHAGLWYLGMTHLGLLALLAAFYLLGGAEAGAAFATLRETGPSLPAPTRNAVFVLAVIGFGSKAGLVPMHVWLPRAHPEAPSHVSALMSAVMVKLGIYGLLRMCLDLLGAGPLWWGAVLIALGAVSALTGVLYALVDDDLKRLLAYSTVENVGLIVLGIGGGFVFMSLRQPVAAAVAFSAALLHVANHAAFKGVLFLAAGSVLHATGVRNMNLMGGLVKRVPVTAAAFLVGAMSIAALPPLNGFVSEWLLFQSFLPGVASPRASVAVLLTIGVGALALTGGLAAATFVKAFGISFLAMPRSSQAEAARESGWLMRAGMLGLAAACPVLALLTAPMLSAIGGVLAGLGGLPASSVTFHGGFTIQTPDAIGRVSPAVIAVMLAAVLAGIVVFVRLTASQARRIGDTWGCGRIRQTSRMEYTSTAFAEPLRRVFGELYRPTDDVSVSVHHESPYHITAMQYRTRLHPWFDRVVYDPAIRTTLRFADTARAIQNGSVNAYLAYMVAVLVLLLAVVMAY